MLFIVVLTEVRCYYAFQCEPSPWWTCGLAILVDLLYRAREWLLDAWERPLPWKQWK